MSSSCRTLHTTADACSDVQPAAKQKKQRRLLHHYANQKPPLVADEQNNEDLALLARDLDMGARADDSDMNFLAKAGVNANIRTTKQGSFHWSAAAA